MSELFDFIKTPEGQGLLSAAFTGLATAQRGAPLNSIGRAGMGGLLGYSNAMNAQDTRAEQEMQRKMRQMQMDEMVRKQGEEQRIRDLAKGSMLSPEQQAIGQFGPTNEGATAIGQFKPKFDTESFVSGLQGINPIEGIKLRQSMAKESPFDKVNPKDFTPASIAKFAQSKNYADLEMQVDPFKMNKADELKQRHLDRLAELQAAGQIAASNRQPNQPMAPIAYVDPATGQTIWGTITEAKGKPAANFNPMVQGAVAGAKESAKTMAEETTKAALDAPRIIDNATQALKYSDELLSHPGFSQAVGKSSMLGLQKIPGTEGRDFMNRLDQLKGGAFLEAFNTLKGGGQITEVEGKKATDAIARMDNSTSEGEFRLAVKDYQEVIKKGMNRAKMKAKPIAPVQQSTQGAKFLGFE